QIRKFYRRADELNLEIIPLVQTLGHMENVLAIDDYKQMREDKERSDVLHPLAKGANKLLTEMIDDVLNSMDKPPRYFHLGADEAWVFGTHTDSAAYIEKHGKAALFTKHFAPLFEHLNSKNVRPLIWHDMLGSMENDAVQNIAKQTDIVGWGYGAQPDKNNGNYRFLVLKRI